MVDIIGISSNSNDMSNMHENEEFEDGELIEDGEICSDDESRDAPVKDEKPSTAVKRPSRFDQQEEHPGKAGSSESWKEEGYGYGGEDRDYRMEGGDKDYRMWAEGDGNGDFDYRDRRRRRSPSPSENPKRPRHSPPMRGHAFGGRGRRPNRWTERQLCKFFREGYCRDKDNCAYSHSAEDSLRKPELCKFYQSGYCKKGLTCPLLHGEFPCKAFHKGECSRDPCQFSHLPLTEYTRPLFEQMLQQDQISSRMAVPPAPVRRRVLLPGGPVPPAAPVAPPPQPGMPLQFPPGYTPSTLVPPVDSTVLPPPSVVVPTLAAPPKILPPAPPSYFAPPKEPSPEAPPPSSSFNITQMLAQIAGTSSDDVIDSPASPPQSIPMPPEVSLSLPTTIPYRLILVETDKCYSNLPLELMANNSQGDPRIARLINNQFDAVSKLIGQEPVQPPPPSRPAPVVDPRQVSRDPRRRPDEKKEDGPRIGWMPQISSSHTYA